MEIHFWPFKMQLYEGTNQSTSNLHHAQILISEPNDWHFRAYANHVRQQRPLKSLYKRGEFCWYQNCFFPPFFAWEASVYLVEEYGTRSNTFMNFTKKELWLIKIAHYPSEKSVLMLDEIESQCCEFEIERCRRDGLTDGKDCISFVTPPSVRTSMSCEQQRRNAMQHRKSQSKNWGLLHNTRIITRRLQQRGISAIAHCCDYL